MPFFRTDGRAPLPRVRLLPHVLDAAGEPRVAILPDGPRSVPVIFPPPSAALPAPRGMERGR